MRIVLQAVLGIAVLAGPVSAKDAPGLLVQSGETWIFQIEQGQPVNSRKVDPQTKPATGELLVTLSPQMGTTMTVTNNTAKFYDYAAFMVRRAGDHGQRTTVCTLLNNGRFAFENWPYSIAAIRLSDFTETDENHMVCR